MLAYLLLEGWPIAWHPFLRVSLAVSALVLAIVWWGWRATGRGVKTRPHRAPRWLDYATIGALALFVESLFLLFFAAVPEKAQAAAVDFGHFIHPERATGSSGGEGIGGESGNSELGEGESLVSGNWLWNEAGKRSLATRMKARPSNKPEVYLYPESVPEGRQLVLDRAYLRSFSLAKYEKSSWSPEAFKTVSHRAEDGVITFPAAERSGNEFSYEIYHQAHPAGRNFLIGMPGLRAAKLPYLREFLPQAYRLSPLPEGEKNYRYGLRSSVQNFDHLLTVENARTLELRPVQDADPVYLELPKEAAVRDTLLEAVASTRGNTVLTLHQIRKNLQERCAYSLEVTNPENRDPLENFLLHEQRGHCELFATAAALICRAAGIPSRVAYGWSGGYYFPSQNFFVFRGKEAHAWTEILLEGYGWVIFDATPSGEEEASTTLAKADETPPINPFQADQSSNPGEPMEVDTAAILRFLKWAAGLSLLAFLLFVFLRHGKRVENGEGDPFANLPESPGYLKRFRRACELRGFPMPVGRTLRQHLAELEAEGCQPEFSEDLLRYHYEMTYAKGEKRPAHEREILSRLKKWARA